jgi:glycosyltransferase involved in cell wall biosynthesis
MAKSRAPKPLKIAVYAICLNEETFVDRFMDSIADADLVVIADTGSTDGTIAAFRRRGVEPHTISIKPWRFDHARNAALALLPDDVDICISLDLDELIMPGWRRVIESAWRRVPINHIMYTHAWSRDVTGRWHTLLDNRIHARHGFTWRFPCHEIVKAEGVTEEIGVVRHLVIEHHPDPDKNRGQYLPLLELAAREEPDLPRHAFYLGREYMFDKRYDDALVEFARYLEIAKPGARGERCAVHRFIARCHEGLGDADSELAALRAATVDAPAVRGPWVDLAWGLYQREDWTACYDAALKALAIPDEVIEYGCDSDTGVLPEDVAAICGWRLGHLDQALIFGRQAMAKAPDVERIRLNVERMEKALGVAPVR